MPPPEPADPDAWQLAVGGEGARAVTLSLKDLKTQFKKTTITATLECSGGGAGGAGTAGAAAPARGSRLAARACTPRAGNRRNEMSRIKQVKGLEWDIGAIGTATWSGVLLRDVLLHAGGRGVGQGGARRGRSWRGGSSLGLVALLAAMHCECGSAVHAPLTACLAPLHAGCACAGLDPDAGTTSEGPQHVHFVGADTDPLAGTTYGASIPIETALAANKVRATLHCTARGMQRVGSWCAGLRRLPPPVAIGRAAATRRAAAACGARE